LFKTFKLQVMSKGIEISNWRDPRDRWSFKLYPILVKKMARVAVLAVFAGLALAQTTPMIWPVRTGGRRG
jgi:hypothetical protein